MTNDDDAARLIATTMAKVRLRPWGGHLDAGAQKAWLREAGDAFMSEAVAVVAALRDAGLIQPPRLLDVHRRALKEELDRLRVLAGRPSLAEISRRTAELSPPGIARSTLHHLMTCTRLPRWWRVELVVKVFGGDVEHVMKLWQEASRERWDQHGRADRAAAPLGALAGDKPADE